MSAMLWAIELDDEIRDHANVAGQERGNVSQFRTHACGALFFELLLVSRSIVWFTLTLCGADS
jgi:hypothetical protein